MRPESLSVPRVLLCSGWQTVNIGDIAHSPAALALLAKYLPQADVTLWAFHPLSPETERMIHRQFPHVTVVGGTVMPNGKTTDPALAAAMDSADFLLHGSSLAMLAWQQAEGLTRRTGHPFGVYGVTYGLYGIPEKATLSRAKFSYFRDSVSLSAARRDGVHAPVMGLAPDVAFAFRLRDDEKAAAFLRESGLEDGRFLCCLSRLRNTPFWEIPGKNTPLDPVKHAHNEAMKEHDHLPLREAIIAVVRQTAINRLGGTEAFRRALDSYFDGGHHWQGNEPGFLTPWLYDYAGRPDKTVDRVRTILAKDYKLAPNGYAGDEDVGAMSSWYVFGAMGFYPNAGQDVYLLGSPLFSTVKVPLGRGKAFTINAKNLTEQNRYIQSATLNWKSWNRAWFRHGDIIGGATFVFRMGPTPSRWGTQDPPPSLSAPKSQPVMSGGPFRDYFDTSGRRDCPATVP